MAARSGYGGHNSIGSGQGVPFTDWIGASWRGRAVGRMAGQWQTRCRQAGNGRACNRARAPLNSASQDQRCGRCKVRRRSERVSRPVREKKRRLRVLVVTTCSPRPMRAVQRARLWAITWTASQAALAAKRQGAAGSAFLGHPGESPRGRIHIMTHVRTESGINWALRAPEIIYVVRAR